EHRFPEALETALQAAIDAVFRRVGGPRRAEGPDALQGCLYERLYQLEAGKLATREAPVPAPDHEHDGRGGRHVREEIHLVEEVRTLAVLPVVLAGAETVRQLVAEPAQVRLAVAGRELVERIEEIGARQVAVQVVLRAGRLQRVVQHLG